MESLKDMYRERVGDKAMEARNANYAAYEKYYMGGRTGGGGYNNPLGKPLLRDALDQAEKDNLVVNIVAQVINHFTAMFAKPPRIKVLPNGPDPSSLGLANKESAYIRFVMNRSNMRAQQPLQSYRYSLKGDAVYGVDWDTAKGQIYMRCYDPSWCYPRFQELDMGAVDDMLLMYKVHRSWVKEQLGLTLPGTEKMVSMFVYWDSEIRQVDIETHNIADLTVTHNLGFVPFRWAFSRPTNEFAMSDIRDVLALQDAYNEIAILMMEALRKTINPAYWGTGANTILTPEPGKATMFADPQAKIAQWPMSEPPAMAMEVMGQVMQDVGRIAGISPISYEGTASGSIVTGTAVRNQVEAIEARSATKRVVLESTYSRLGEYVLRILEAKFPDTPLAFVQKNGMDQIKGSEVKGWYECEADYGEFFGMDMSRKVQMALQGLGRLWDERFAIEHIIQPEEHDAGEFVKRLEDYQIRQAGLTARAQAVAQEQAQQSQQPGPQPGQPPGPQTPQKPQPPTPQSFQASLGKIQDAIHLVEANLHGSVWAVGELAIAGQSSSPMLMVQKMQDLGPVNSLIQTFKGQAVSGSPNGLPNVKLV